jgi:hypothetical protein
MVWEQKEIVMTKQPSQRRYVDLVISESTTEALDSDNFRFCTISKNRGQRTINLRLPDEIQAKIIAAYEQGKAVRIFA